MANKDDLFLVGRRLRRGRRISGRGDFGGAHSPEVVLQGDDSDEHFLFGKSGGNSSGRRKGPSNPKQRHEDGDPEKC